MERLRAAVAERDALAPLMTASLDQLCCELRDLAVLATAWRVIRDAESSGAG